MLKPLILVIAGLMTVGFSTRNMLNERALASHGKEATVEPVAGYTKTVHKNRNTTTTRIDADVTFQTEAGERITVNKGLSREQLSKLASGQPVSIRYLPESPRTTRLEGEPPWGWNMIGIGGMVLALGAFWLWRTTRAPIRRDR